MPHTITMPQLGETVAEGTVLAWLKEVGDFAPDDDVVVKISTDKVDTEVPSLVADVVLKILVETGQTVDIGTPLAILDAKHPDFDGSGISSEGAEEVANDLRSPNDSEDMKRTLSPVVRRLADESGVDLSVVVGSGSRITRRDITAFIEAQDDPAASDEKHVPVTAPLGL